MTLPHTLPVSLQLVVHWAASGGNTHLQAAATSLRLLLSPPASSAIVYVESLLGALKHIPVHKQDVNDPADTAAAGRHARKWLMQLQSHH